MRRTRADGAASCSACVRRCGARPSARSSAPHAGAPARRRPPPRCSSRRQGDAAHDRHGRRRGALHLAGLDRAAWRAARRHLPAAAARAHVVLARVRHGADAALDLLPRPVRDPRHDRRRRRLGQRASHGCVRLHPDNAATLFVWCNSKARPILGIVISRYGATRAPAAAIAGKEAADGRLPGEDRVPEVARLLARRHHAGRPHRLARRPDRDARRARAATSRAISTRR